VAVRNTTAARDLNRTLGAIPRSPELEEDSPAGETARHALGALLSTYGEQFASIGVQLGARYDASPVIAADCERPPDSLTRYEPTSIPGGRAPHLWLDDWHGPGSSLFDRLGVGFTLLRLGPRPADGRPLAEAARARGLPLHVLDIPDSQARELYERDLVLVRPDQHVAWRGNRLPDDASALLARLVGGCREDVGSASPGAGFS
jgi:hypothetical protein